MSLSRLALRLATIEALCPTAAMRIRSGFPTIAGAGVDDSRIDPIDDLSPQEMRPVIVVYTEHDASVAGQKRGGPPYLNTVDLVFELSVVARIDSGDDPEIYEVGFPETDAELETSLDLLGAQIHFILNYGPTGEIWRKVSKSRIHEPHSIVHRTSEEGVRLARRTVTWKVEVNEDQYRDAAPAARPAGFDIFPEPLRSFAMEVAPDSYAYKVLKGLADEPTFPTPPVLPSLSEVTLGVKVTDPNGNIPTTPNIQADVDNLDQ